MYATERSQSIPIFFLIYLVIEKIKPPQYSQIKRSY